MKQRNRDRMKKVDFFPGGGEPLFAGLNGSRERRGAARSSSEQLVEGVVKASRC